jgi:histone deacetylase 1/2
MVKAYDREYFERAMELEVKTLEEYGTWKIVDRSSVPSGTKVLPSTWAFRRKRSPDGTITKRKARFCVRGDLQDPGSEETYSPVVQSSTIRMVMIMALIQKWECVQCDFVNAFAQSYLKEPIFIEAPKGFTCDGVLQLVRSLYGLVTAPNLFYEHLKANLLKRGFKPSPHDPCLFMSPKVICLVYVDDCLFFSPSETNILKVLDDLKQEMNLTIEGKDVMKFLGMNVKREGSTYTLTQPGLINKIIEATGLTSCNVEHTPASDTPLGSHPESPESTETWKYASIVGMLMYVANTTRPDIAFAVHQVARYSHNARDIHFKAVKRIVRYLKGTSTQGMKFSTNLEAGLEMFCDADFAGLWKVEDRTTPDSVRSRTGYVIKLFGCPMLWTSRLQTEIAVSTLEAEYISLSSGMRELLPIRELYLQLARLTSLKTTTTTVRCTVFEDNEGAESLAKSPKLTPRTKHIGVKYHFFRGHIKSGVIEINHVASADQQADILTKGLGRVKFIALRTLLCGW